MLCYPPSRANRNIRTIHGSAKVKCTGLERAYLSYQRRVIFLIHGFFLFVETLLLKHVARILCNILPKIKKNVKLLRF